MRLTLSYKERPPKWQILVDLNAIESDSSVRFSSLAQLCLTLCNPMAWSTAGLCIHHQLPELAQAHVHSVSDAIQSSHPLLSPSHPPRLSIRVFSNESVFTSGGQSIGVSASASVLPMNTQGWSPLGWTGWISLQSKGLSRVLSITTVQKHQFLSTQLSSQSSSHTHTWLLEKP